MTPPAEVAGLVERFDSHDRMADLVERMLGLHKQLAAAKTAQDETMIQRQIDATDRQIDRVVYELYDLPYPLKAS